MATAPDCREREKCSALGGDKGRRELKDSAELRARVAGPPIRIAGCFFFQRVGGGEGAPLLS